MSVTDSVKGSQFPRSDIRLAPAREGLGGIKRAKPLATTHPQLRGPTGARLGPSILDPPHGRALVRHDRRSVRE